ncbi:MAG: NAD(P)H-dependent oxidoreductase [Planctomycetota bacterium]
MIKVITIYWSGYGHTKCLAEAVHGGVSGVGGVEAHLLDAENHGEPDKLDMFDDADAIIFGTPTYMGGPAAAFKKFMDAAGQKWLSQAWKDKIAGGFTNSGSLSGDKQGTLQALIVNALQHGMIWVGQAEMPENNERIESPGPDAVNRFGAFMGVMSKSNSAGGGPSEGDLKTGRLYGKRVAEVTLKFRG